MTNASRGASANDAPNPPLLRMEGIGKSFLGVNVLTAVDLELRGGEVHALVGENGAGKSTLMKILAGVHQPDAGRVVLDGAGVRFAHPVDAQAAGVSTVFQEFNLLPERTVAENVFLGREPLRRGVVDARRMQADTAQLLDDLEIPGIAPTVKVGTLSIAEQQIVEIVKALSADARILSMDEPTAALADAEVEVLYRLVHRLRARGMAILYVSHRLKEIFDLADTVTVLKDGQRVGSLTPATTTPEELIRQMVGRPVSTVFPDKPPRSEEPPVRLRIRGAGNRQLDGITLDLGGGEVVGVAGLQGSGRTELAHALFGLERFTRGTVELDGAPVTLTSPRTAIGAGVAMVAEDRKAQGLALNQSVIANARLVLDSVFGTQSNRRARQIPGILSSLELVSRGEQQEVRFLSGGNQQKVVLAKWLATDPTVILLDEPTRGIDVGAKQAVYRAIQELASTGVAILLISSELPEILGLADRIVVLHDGRIAGELPAGVDEEAVMALATGHSAAAPPTADALGVGDDAGPDHAEGRDAGVASPGRTDARGEPPSERADGPESDQ
ncbi:sugar ABC transporter ATP-binding protein [Spiractinospora alimapuensis]|uniref:sugar ABC transporter ATP-binding protein n=1 Tax=Spiractinospora alimapuensis TaxID=2820884 RepID=UPI001F3A8559|nr:sugar ABC transporter ATP-binding protein [Spiractinospora alimapuensis]QVQ53341.1 sugar ABC transporter ATP-binding protein [Spiractinospora alimapuensis]